MKPTVSFENRSWQLFRQMRQEVFSRTDRMFSNLAILQFLAGIAVALLVTPLTYVGLQESFHIHLYAALILGVLTASPIVYLARFHPGKLSTRCLIASCQMLASALLIHLSGGRIETHFHIFGSLAFLSFYRDWRVFIPATFIVALDHMIRGIYYPESVFGVLTASNWRWIEHAAWVIFCNYFLVRSVVRQRQEMWETAKHQAELERTAFTVEQEVALRTAQLSAEREKFESAFQFAPVGMLLVRSNDGCITKVNEEVTKILDFTEEELMGRRLSEFAEQGTESTEILALAELQCNIDEECQYRRRDGSLAPVIFKASLQSSFQDATSPLYIVQLLDVTQRVEAEAQLAQQKELALRSQKMESLGVLTGGIAHELNSPIQFIGDNLRFLKESFEDLEEILTPLDTETTPPDLGTLVKAAKDLDLAELIEEIPVSIKESLDGVKRVGNIVASMKDYAHPGTEMGDVDINEVLELASTVSRNEWKYVSEMKMDLAPNLPPVSGSRGELIQVFLNLMVNATHAIQEKGVAEDGSLGLIQVRTRANEHIVSVEIEDSGTGIPESIIAKIFDPFYTTKEVGKGTGQGLAISNTIIENHGGGLRVRSVVNEGSCFMIEFPIKSTLVDAA